VNPCKEAFRMTTASTRTRALAGAALLAAALAAPAGAQQPERYALRGERVSIHNLAGEVRLVGGTGQEVVVEVARGGDDARELRVNRGRDDGAERLVVVTPGTRVVYPRMGSRSTSTLSVREDGTFGRGGRRVTVSGGGRGTRAYADLTVRVPAGRSVTLHQGVGKVEVANVDGDLVLNTSSASVASAGTRGSLSVDVGSGSVRVERAQGDVDVDTGSGSVRLADVRGRRLSVDTGSGSVAGSGLAADDVMVDVGSGAVELSGVRAGALKVDTGSGSVQLSLAADARTVEVDTGSGSVRLAVPSSFGAELEIDTGSGGIQVDVPAQAQTVRRDHYRGRIGDGRGRVEIDTGSGGVRITRS
jgi:lia operon protein LiaG